MEKERKKRKEKKRGNKIKRNEKGMALSEWRKRTKVGIKKKGQYLRRKSRRIIVGKRAEEVPEC